MRVLRQASDEEQRTTNFELFFDLVFVFAATQLSALLRSRLDWVGAAQTLLLFLLVWWAWGYTTWLAGWFDPDAQVVRAVLIGVMLGSLLMAVGIPGAFGERGLLVAGAYAALQVGRNAFTVMAVSSETPLGASYRRILAWSVASGAILIAGGLADDGLRWGLWIAALAVDYTGPAARYWMPGLGRDSTRNWGSIDAGRFAERFQLFVIIALGESVVATGLTATDRRLDSEHLVMLSLAFLTSAALWWLYFDHDATMATERLRTAADPGRMFRDAFTYLHLPIVLGIVVSAVGDAVSIAAPLDPMPLPARAAALGGPALYLLGHVAVGRRLGGVWKTRRLVSAAALAGLIPLTWWADAIVVNAALMATLVVLILHEARLHRPAREETASAARVSG